MYGWKLRGECQKFAKKLPLIEKYIFLQNLIHIPTILYIMITLMKQSHFLGLSKSEDSEKKQIEVFLPRQSLGWPAV